MMKPDSRLVEALHPSPNVGVRRDGCRPRLILFHYTGMESAAKAIDWLAPAAIKSRQQKRQFQGVAPALPARANIAHVV